MNDDARSGQRLAPGGFDRRSLSMLVVLCAALILDALDVSMMGVAIPSIRDELGMDTRAAQWVVSSYVLGYGGFLLLGGRAADLFGRRRMFIASMSVFLLTSGIGGLATNGVTLIAARFATGVSAAFTAPAGLSIITTTFAEGPTRDRALAIYTATGATGFSLGLVLGGLLTEVGWRYVFFVPVVLSGLTIAGARRLLPRETGVRAVRARFDVVGAVTVTGSMLLLALVLTQAPDVGWLSWRTLGLAVATAALMCAFVAHERRSPSPLVRLGILRSSALVRANFGALTLLGAWIGFLFITTLYLQQLRGWSAIHTGLAVFPAGLIVAALAPRIAAPLVSRHGTAKVIVAGLASHSVAYALFTRIRLDSTYLTGMLPTFVLVGVGFALAYGPLNMAATAGVASHEQGLSSGLVNMSLQFGAALGLAIVTAVNQAAGAGATAPEAVMDGFHAALVVPALIALSGAAVMATAIRRQVGDAESTSTSVLLGG